MEKKLWYQSKTIWLNVVMVITSALSANDIGLPAETLKWIAMVGGIANVLLRMVTNKALGGES